MTHVKSWILYAAWCIALLGLIVSLSESEIAHALVCRLCWYERVCFFPLSVILGIASYYEDGSVIRYAIPFSILSMLFSMFHYLFQTFPEQLHFLCNENLCRSKDNDPLLCFFASLVIFVCLLILRKEK